MKPTFQVTSQILRLVSEISKILGQLNHIQQAPPRVELRRQNQIRTIHSSLAIEGNTLTLEQVTALTEGKRVLGPAKDIKEVLNAAEVYQKLDKFKSHQVSSFLAAHKMLMQGLVESAGKLRNKNVGVFAGPQVRHMAPPHRLIAGHVEKLFLFIKADREILPLIKSCVVHYEIEFIHPFEDGNGRMGRLWQTLILREEHPVFDFLPVESVIRTHQKEYYAVLERCDRKGDSTEFIEFSLETILTALQEQSLDLKPRSPGIQERIAYAREKLGTEIFSRKDYHALFPALSLPTASRDLAWACGEKILIKTGEKATVRYRFENSK